MPKIRYPPVTRAAFLALLPFAWTCTALADPPEGWDFQRFDQAWEAASQSQKPIFLYFGRHGCPSCEKTNLESFSDPRVKERFHVHYELAYADAESGERLRFPNGERITEMELGVKLKVFGTPFFYFMDPGGKPVYRAPGYQSAEEFLRYDDYVSGGHYKQYTFAEYKARGS